MFVLDPAASRHSRRVNHLHVAVLVLPVELFGRGVHARLVVAELEETLETAGRVLGTLTVVTVREVHDETCALEPLALTSSEELVDDALRVVGEITKLGLPDGERV